MSETIFSVNSATGFICFVFRAWRMPTCSALFLFELTWADSSGWVFPLLQQEDGGRWQGRWMFNTPAPPLFAFKSPFSLQWPKQNSIPESSGGGGVGGWQETFSVKDQIGHTLRAQRVLVASTYCVVLTWKHSKKRRPWIDGDRTSLTELDGGRPLAHGPELPGLI